MRYMMLLSGTNPSTPPSPELFEAIMKLGGEATEAGVLLDTAGLLPSASGARVSLAGGKLTVTDGPFTESKELISYALYEVRSKDEAVEWASRFIRLHRDLWPGWTGATDVLQVMGPRRRGLAMGLNEAAGYLAVSAAALVAGYLAATYALRPQPFLLGLVFAGLGLTLSWLGVRESRDYALLEAAQTQAGDLNAPPTPAPSFGEVMAQTSWKNRTLFAVCQAGLVNNLNDGLSWGLFPLYFAAAGLSTEQIGILVAAYPAIWGVGQLATGALSDQWGRKWLIVAGMLTQACGLFLMVAVRAFWPWLAGAVLLGIGTALVYPTLLAAVSDVVHPSYRASAVGVYRLWRDGGYALGALLAGGIADLLGIPWAIGVVGGLTALSGVLVACTMRETLARWALPEDGFVLTESFSDRKKEERVNVVGEQGS